MCANTRYSVALVISSLQAGGAERVMSMMANYWAARGWRICLIKFDDGMSAPFYPLDPAIELKSIDFPLLRSRCHRVIGNVRCLLALRAALRAARPSVVISFMEYANIFTVIAAIGLRLPVIVSERTNPFLYNVGNWLNVLRNLTYPRAAHLVVQTDAALSYFSPRVRHRGRVIPNPVPAPEGQSQPTSLLRGSQYGTPRVMAMGRLDQNKSFDLLIRVFSKLAAQHPEWTLEIWGDGPLRISLETLVEKLGLQDRVGLPGLTKEPWVKMRRADLFVLSSRYEGFPNVLCEAMACGAPVISFDCPSGPSEIIRDGIDGVLVPPGDEAALAAAMARLMDHPEERERLAARAPEVLDRFSLEKVMAMWERTLDGARRHIVDRTYSEPLDQRND